MAINLKYVYIQGDTEVDILQKNKENIIQISKESGTGAVLVDDTALIALQNDPI